jgi:hypothetical protein
MTTQTEIAHIIVSEERTIHVIGLIEAGHSPTATSWDLAETVIRTLWDDEVAVSGYRVEVQPDGEELVYLTVEAFGEWDESVGWASPESFWGSVDDDVRSLTGDGWRIVSCRMTELQRPRDTGRS